MSQAVGFAPVKKNPRIRVKLNVAAGINLNNAIYDNPNILYATERASDGTTVSFIANWPLSDPTEACWDVPGNWRLTGTITTQDPKSQQAATTRQARFACSKIHVYQDGDGLRLLLLSEIKEIEELAGRPMTKLKGPAGRAVPKAEHAPTPAKPKTKAAEAAEKRAVRAEVVAQSPPTEPELDPGVSKGEPDDAELP